MALSWLSEADEIETEVLFPDTDKAIDSLQRWTESKKTSQNFGQKKKNLNFELFKHTTQDMS